MKDLFGRAHQWWDGRTLREQRMLGLMVLLAAVVVVWLGVIRPALVWREAAAAERVEAEAELVEVREGLLRLARLQSPEPVAADAGGLEPLARRTAEAAGLEVSTAMDATGGLGFRIASGSSAAVFGWLAALQADHGVDVRTLGVVENTDATLQVEGSLSR
jgi:general secretion pathway protein M